MLQQSITDLDAYQKQITEGIQTLFGHQGALLSQKKDHIITSENATAYLDARNEVSNALADIYAVSQTSSKELYESLLTTQLKEIMPHNDECDRVVLNNDCKRGRPTLNVEVATVSGKLRDVYLDKGGSIENLIAIGLRFICLCRTTNRRFLVLDEADAAVNPKYAASFASMLYSLSTTLGVQVIYITHKEPENYFGKGRIHQFKRRNGKIINEIISDIDHSDIKVTGIDGNEESAMFEDVGFKYIRLTNFKQHENTVIELSPFVNYIVGDNDVGKTAVVQAIEALTLNKGRDKLIRDDMEACQVEFGLEGDYALKYQYMAKGAKKTSYELINENGDEIERSNSGEKLPDWLGGYLLMPLVNGMNIHISDQHNSSFILDKSISEHKKAEMLSLDDSSQMIHKMISRHHEQIDMHRRNQASAKQELAKVDSKLSKIRELERAVAESDELGTIIVGLKKSVDSINPLSKLIGDIESTTIQIGALAQVEELSIENVSVKETGSIYELLGSIEREGVVISNLSQVDELAVAIPSYLETSEIGALLSAIDLCESELTSLSGIDNLNVELVEFKETLDVGQMLSEIDKVSLTLSTLADLNSIVLDTVEYRDNSVLITLIKGIQLASKEIHAIGDLSDLEVKSPDVKPLKDISMLGKKIGFESSEINKLMHQITQEQSVISQYDEQLSSILGQSDLCPLCKQAIQKH
ncbi:AAA family ATPase [Vibrio splendidus]|nr:AAA family ATPase [Vibrio splendidus]MCC4882973.1 AAA family ATPase [Vibrio splendidus]